MNRDDDFKYDVFVSYSSKDKIVARSIAERLRADGLRIWFDEWKIRSRETAATKIEDGLEQSRALVFCMSSAAFGSDWNQLEAMTLRFRDPVNTDRRFIPLRLDSSPIEEPLSQLGYIDWLTKAQEEYAKLLEACKPPAKPLFGESQATRELVADETISIGPLPTVYVYAFSPDGECVLSGSLNHQLLLLDITTSQKRVLNGHTDQVKSVVISKTRRRALSGSYDKTLRLWDLNTGDCLRVLQGHDHAVRTIALSADGRYALSGSEDTTLRLWDLAIGNCLGVLNGHTKGIWSVTWSKDQRLALSGSADNTLMVWALPSGRCLRVLEGHTGLVRTVSFSADERYVISGSYDGTLRLWEVQTGRCLQVINAHESDVRSVAWSSDQRYVLSGSLDKTVRLWDIGTGKCLNILKGHSGSVQSVAWKTDQYQAFSGDSQGNICCWDLAEVSISQQTNESISSTSNTAPEQVQYTNAKVLLVGESGVGKTGLSKRLATCDWQPSDSTVGAWATQWKLEVSGSDGVEREIWLWDFGGQADQRLIHQLYMDETALAVLVFDGQKEDLFETLGQWDRDLSRASRKPFTKLLAAGRVDAGGLRVSRKQIEGFAKERGYTEFLETSAKQNISCEDLKNAIVKGIQWDEIPWRSSPLLFKLLKEEIIRLKDEGRVLLRFNELRESLQLRLMGNKFGEVARFTDEELKAVIGLLASPGIVWELKFGSWVLLQPERINAYAQAVIQTMREDENERGCLAEERVLNGTLTYHSSVERLKGDEERFVLLAMHQTLVERGLCLRQHTEQGSLLIFPSYYRRERDELIGHPAVLVSYRFNGFLDELYATLVVRLHHTQPFEQDKLWRYAADFTTLTGKKLGIRLTRRSEGAGALDVYFDPSIPIEEKIIFSKYVHEHLLQNATEVLRLRYYVCPYCGTPAGNPETAMKKLEAGKKDMPCIECDDPKKRIPLWDELEEMFASPEMKQRVRDLQQQSDIVLDNESKDRALVGDVISTVALAGQLSREFNVSDHGIDMEIEFKAENGEATGRKLYLQLKSGDSYLKQRKKDGAEVFRIKDERHTRYWISQAFPVFLVIRDSEGKVRWMEIRDHLKQISDGGKKPVTQFVFEGERFDSMSVRRWRQKMLNLTHA